MSTILNILKKLEEEKSVLEQGINLRGLVLQSERPAPSRTGKERSRNAGMFAALVGGGIAAGVALGFLFVQPDSREKPKTVPVVREARSPSLGSPSAAQAQPLAPEEKKEDRIGIPLSSIKEEDAENPEPSPAAKAALAASPPIDLIVAPAKTEPKAPKPEQTTPAHAPEAEGNPLDFREINAIIENSKVEKVASLPARPKEVSPEYKPIRIPGFKVKGIIYFGKDNPANYILASMPQDPNLKIKSGENIMGATLKEVQPGSAIFLYKGELAQMRIGE